MTKLVKRIQKHGHIRTRELENFLLSTVQDSGRSENYMVDFRDRVERAIRYCRHKGDDFIEYEYALRDVLPMLHVEPTLD